MLDRVAAALRAMAPDFPIPVTTTRPRHSRIRWQARAKLSPTRSASCATAAASCRSTSAAVRIRSASVTPAANQTRVFAVLTAPVLVALTLAQAGRDSRPLRAPLAIAVAIALVTPGFFVWKGSPHLADWGPWTALLR